MSNAKEFEELLRSDKTLQEKLKAAFEAWEGDASDERAAFEAVMAPLAAEAGLPFTYEEAKELAEESDELSLDDLDAAAGGFELEACFGYGIEVGTNPYPDARPAGLADARPAGA